MNSDDLHDRKIKLRFILNEKFDVSDLIVLCEDLGIDSDSVSILDNKILFISRLVNYCYRHDKLEHLERRVYQLRPPQVPKEVVNEAVSTRSLEISEATKSFKQTPAHVAIPERKTKGFLGELAYIFKIVFYILLIVAGYYSALVLLSDLPIPDFFLSKPNPLSTPSVTNTPDVRVEINKTVAGHFGKTDSSVARMRIDYMVVKADQLLLHLSLSTESTRNDECLYLSAEPSLVKSGYGNFGELQESGGMLVDVMKIRTYLSKTHSTQITCGTSEKEGWITFQTNKSQFVTKGLYTLDFFSKSSTKPFSPLDFEIQ